MLLAIDIGNSRIKWGLFEGLQCRSVGYFITRDFQPGDPAAYEFEPTTFPDLPGEPGAISARAGAPDGADLRAVRHIAVCSVAHGEAEAAVLAHLQALGLPALPVWHLGASANACDVVNGYAQPERLGADRWAALVAARHLQRPAGLPGVPDRPAPPGLSGLAEPSGLSGAPSPSAAVVVMAGTATTVDALDGSGRFLGGYILPGLRLMPKSLYERTAGIRPDEGQWAEFPGSTADAVTSGVLAATAGAIAGMVLRLQARLAGGAGGAGAPIVVMSGGNGPALTPQLHDLGVVHTYQRDLVLHGIARLWGKART